MERWWECGWSGDEGAGAAVVEVRRKRSMVRRCSGRGAGKVAAVVREGRRGGAVMGVRGSGGGST